MASDEQFSLCWNNFHANMSAGFHGLLSRGDLVDVTLAAEGRLLQAHKLVLSVCSPFFQEMFKMNPTQHPIVFLKDVSHSALRDLLQFMYQGEVNVKQEELASFISTAEQLQVKGLTGNQNDDSSTPSKPKPTSRPGPRSSQNRQSAKIETDLDSKPSSTPVAIKRPNRPSIASNNSSSSSGPAKRKCVDPLEAGPSGSAKEEFVTIPDEDENNAVAPKMEPEFVNESMWDDDDDGTNNDDTNFGEDDSNMEMTGFDGSATGDGNITGGEGGAVGDAQDSLLTDDDNGEKRPALYPTSFDMSSPSSDSEEDSDDTERDPDYTKTKLKPSVIPKSESDSCDSFVLGTPDILTLPTASTSDASTFDHGNAYITNKTKKNRKREANPNKWTQNKAKLLRSAGLSYTNSKNVEKRARILKPPCSDKCRLKCAQNISHEDRQAIFRSYWDLKDINRQRDMINRSMIPIHTKYRYTTTEKGRNLNNAFHFTVNSKQIRVCKIFFCNTLDISSTVIQTVLDKRTSVHAVADDMRGKHKNHRKVPDGIKDGVRKHIEKNLRTGSHSLRQQTTRQFKDGGKTIADLHNDYKQECINNVQPYANYGMYAKIYNKEYN